MTKEWCEKKQKEMDDALEAELIDVKSKLHTAFTSLDAEDDEVRDIIDSIEIEEPYCSHKQAFELEFGIIGLMIDKGKIEKEQLDEVNRTIERIRGLNRSSAAFYQDTRELDVDGNLVITDPCYLIPDTKSIQERDNLWESLDGMIDEYGLQRSTIYGDWSCTAFNSDTNEQIGRFCADGGMVCAIPLEKVLEFNPAFDWFETRPWTTTLVKDFKGKVQIVVDVDEDHTADYEYATVHVVGNGINKVTGLPFNFITEQTGL